MKLLCGFVNAMKGIGVADNLKIEFEQIDTILNASTELPDDVSAAIQRVRAGCAGSAERGCVLLPSLEGLATGKRLMELAEQTRKSREEAFAYLMNFLSCGLNWQKSVRRSTQPMQSPVTT